MAGLGALADLEFDHLDLIVGSDAREFFGVERPVAVATTEISGTDFPDQVTAILAVIGTDAALAGVMREPSLFCPGVQRAHGIWTERAEAHGRNVEHGGRIRLRAIRAADFESKFFFGSSLWRDRMIDPLVAVAIDVLLGAERSLVQHHLGTLVDHRASVAAERHSVLFALEEILPHLRPDLFQQEPQMGRYRIVTQNRVALLREVANPERRQASEDQDRHQDDIEDFAVHDAKPEKQCGHHGADRKDDEPWRERKQQRLHGNSSGRPCRSLFSAAAGPTIGTMLYTIHLAEVRRCEPG